MNNNDAPKCPICGNPLAVRIARGRKSGKPFVMFICPKDGRHFRGFINHHQYVQEFLDKLESLQEKKAEGK